MPCFGVALAWIIISPLAFLTDCLSIIFILHYKPLYHSCDVAFISLFVTMATNAWLLLPIPAVVKLADFYWSQSLCAFYTWLSITLRSSHILVLLVLNVYWMASLRVSPKSKLFISSKPITVAVCICWFISLVIGFIPAADVAHVFDYYEDNVCKFLPANISRGYAIFFIIVPLVSTVMGVVSSLDSLLLFKAMKDVALTKYSAERFHLPTISGGVRTSALIHAKYNELNVTIELCRLVLFFSMASSVLNAVPLLASQFVQLIQEYSQETLETTLLWLVLMEALILPHFLWLLSRRYRHAVAYTWKVFVLRDTSAREEDTASCSLQAFRVNVKDVTSRPYRNGGVTARQINGTVSGPGIEEHSQETYRNGIYNTPRSRTNGFLHPEPASGHGNGVLEYHLDVTTDTDIELTPVKRITSPEVVILHETSRQGMTRTQMKGQDYNDVYETSLSSQNNKGDNSTHPNSVGVIPDASPVNSAHYTSPVNSPTKADSARHVKRSISGSSRIEWKERMMKKHLPAVFLGSSVEDETDTEPSPGCVTQTENMAPDNVHEKSTSGRRQDAKSRMSANWSSTESTYYLSGDYHYNYLNDTLGRTQTHTTTEADEKAGKYAEEDIGYILDNSLTSETVVDDYDSDNYLLKSINTDQNEPRRELFKNVTHAPRAIKDLALPSAENHPQEIKNSQSKYSEDVPTTTSKFDLPRYDLLDQETITSVSNDRTVLGGRSSAENLPEPTATIISVSAVQPSILRSNYRKFLPYTDLIISDVDDAPVDSDFERDGGLKDFTFKSEHINEGSNSPNKAKITEKETEYSLQTPERNCELAAVVKDIRDDVGDDVQDYSKCETVSGSEMLRLKMQSIRAAAAVYYSDDTTSDDGGIDNNGFTETSNDDSDDNTDQYDEKQNSKIKITMTGNDVDWKRMKSNSSNQLKCTSQVDDDDEFTKMRLERDRVGDGEESMAEVSPHGKATSASYKLVKGQGNNQKKSSITRNDKPMGENQKETFVNKNDESKGDNLKKESVIRNDNQRVKAGDIIESNPSDHLNITDNLRLSDLAKTTPQNVGHRTENTSQDDAYTDLPDVQPAASITEFNVVQAEHSTHSTKQPGIIAKPPRHRKHSDESQAMSSNTINDSIHDTIEDFAVSTTPTYGPSPVITNCVIPIEDTAIDSDISEVTDSDSTGSDLSVTLEPYGYRRPDWMNDLLLETSSYGQTMYKQAREFSSLEEESTDFMSNNNDDFSNEIELKTLDKHENLGVSYNGTQLPNISHQPRPLLIPNHFNDQTDTDYENPITIDYSAQSNFYRHKNLYFEAIKEEPEDLLSDSASSFDQSENITSNNFRDPPINSNVLSPNFAAKSISATSINQFYSSKPPRFQQNSTAISGDNLTLPTSERTSADGSEEIPQLNASTCLSISQTANNTSTKTNITNDPHAMQQTLSVTNLVNQIVHRDPSSTSLSVKQTERQELSSPNATISDNVSFASLSSNVHKHESMMIPDYTSANNGYNHGNTNNVSVDFYNGVQFPHTVGTEPRRGEVPGATPVYF